MKKINWGLVALSFLSLFCVGIADNGRSAIYPDILQQLGLTYEQGALLFSISSLTGLISTTSAKYWLPNFGIIVPQRFFSILLIIASTIFGLSFSYFPSYFLAVVGVGLLGITMGGLSITMNLSIDQAVPMEYRRKFLSGLHSLYGLSSGFAPVLLIFLTTWGFSFKELYFVIALFPILLFILSMNTKKFPREEIEKLSLNNESSKIPFPTIFATASILSFYVCSEVLLSSRFMIICKTLFNLPKEAAQSYLSLFFMFLTLGRFIFAFIKTKKSNFNILLISNLISLVFFFLGIKYGPFFFSLIGLSMAIFFPCAMDYIAVKFGDQFQRGLPVVMNIITVELISMHLISGVIEERVGPGIIIYFSIALLLLSLLFLIFQSRKTS